MGEDPQRLESEIEKTRIKLGQDIDALEEKVNPKKVAHRSVDRAKEKVAEAREKVAEAVGTARDRVTDAAATAKDEAGPLAATARDKVAPLAATAKEKAAERVGMDPATADTREVATAVVGGTWSTLLEQTRRNPLVMGGVAVALGLVLGHR